LKAHALYKQLELEWKEFQDIGQSVGCDDLNTPNRTITTEQAVAITIELCKRKEAKRAAKEAEKNVHSFVPKEFGQMSKYTIYGTLFFCLCMFFSWLSLSFANWLFPPNVPKPIFFFFRHVAPWILMSGSTILLTLNMFALLRAKWREVFPLAVMPGGEKE
tara:strand:- start:5420 stop:5902 length:483 start_codon:yes stop_codon:yes gene_type:complete